jgi:hypothetical protein
MFSEGANIKASKGLLDPRGGFDIVVPYIDQISRKTQTKSYKPETSCSP